MPNEFAGSYNGSTADSESAYLGSSPSPAALTFLNDPDPIYNRGRESLESDNARLRSLFKSYSPARLWRE